MSGEITAYSHESAASANETEPEKPQKTESPAAAITKKIIRFNTLFRIDNIINKNI